MMRMGAAGGLLMVIQLLNSCKSAMAIKEFQKLAEAFEEGVVSRAELSQIEDELSQLALDRLGRNGRA